MAEKPLYIFHFDLVKLGDIQRAGQQPEEIIHQISETVYTMYKAFIEPGFSGLLKSKYPFTGFQSPTYILKIQSRANHIKGCGIKMESTASCLRFGPFRVFFPCGEYLWLWLHRGMSTQRDKNLSRLSSNFVFYFWSGQWLFDKFYNASFILILPISQGFATRLSWCLWYNQISTLSHMDSVKVMHQLDNLCSLMRESSSAERSRLTRMGSSDSSSRD
ncbi:hypothetical protein YC2023_109736 [Brassica napus]